MRKRVHIYILGWVCRIMAGLLLFPAVVAAIYREGTPLRAFGLTAIISLVLGMVMAYKKPDMDCLTARDGYIIAAEAWIVVSLLGALPFYLSGEVPSFVDCLFESVSGFTTTGSSILTNVEALSHATLFWRSFSHWIGGMGVLVFMLAIVSLAGGKSIYIMRAESPGPIVDKLVPKMRHSSAILYGIYVGMTVVLIVLLIAGGMPVFDSLCNAFGTAGTGGFAIKNASIGFYGPYFQWVIAIFMMLFGVNFNVYFLLSLGKLREALKTEETWAYLAIMLTTAGLIVWNLWGSFSTLEELVRHAFFQTSSVMTTTGYATVDFNLWPSFSKALLLTLTFIGGCAGSTAGGFKVVRVVLIAKIALREVRHLARPRSVEVIRLGGKAVSEDTVKSVANYLALYVLLFVLSALAVASGDYDLATSFSAVASCFNNVGPALGEAGPMGNFHFFSDFEKLVLTADMLIGRLEIVPMMVLFARLLSRRSSRHSLSNRFREGWAAR